MTDPRPRQRSDNGGEESSFFLVERYGLDFDDFTRARARYFDDLRLQSEIARLEAALRATGDTRGVDPGSL